MLAYTRSLNFAKIYATISVYGVIDTAESNSVKLVPPRSQKHLEVIYFESNFISFSPNLNILYNFTQFLALYFSWVLLNWTQDSWAKTFLSRVSRLWSYFSATFKFNFFCPLRCHWHCVTVETPPWCMSLLILIRQSQAPRCHWYRGIKLRSIIDIMELQLLKG